MRGPEFIISSPSNSDFLLIVECKADPKNHKSNKIDQWLNGDELEESAETYSKRVQRFAVDGVLHYATRLAKEFTVLAVAVSGETLSSSHFDVYLCPKGSSLPHVLKSKEGKPIDEMVPWEDFIRHATFDPTIQRLRFAELMDFARELHEFMRDHAKLSESEKPLLVSGTLIALRNAAFAFSFHAHSPEDLQKEWMKVIQTEIHKASIPQAKKDNMTQPYSSIEVHPELGKASVKYPKGPLYELVKRLNEKVWPFISIYHDFDVVGQFYGEFLKYTGGDKKALGIVLTPRHVTELFAKLANVDKGSVVLDICAGTGGFLISAMHQMMRTTTTEAQRAKIREKGLVGVEQQPNMFALAASNIILRGDGKANLYQGSCFDIAISKAIKAHKADVGLLNPPFSQSDADLHELKFIKQMLDSLRKGGTGIAIVPMSCAISPHPVKSELLKSHTLEAVMSMPDELFYPVGVITCVMIFTAHIPHETSNKKTWFGYWKNDGFIKTKHRGRIDLNHKWPQVCEHWVTMFRDREIHPGESISKKVDVNDEWCAEAYMETDYETLTQADFERELKRYLAFRILNGAENDSEDAEQESESGELINSDEN